ncbi:PIG-P, partial [Thamnocephalis sphaerospora]
MPPLTPAISDALRRQRSYEYNGFILYLVSIILYLIYALWAFLPDQVLVHVGISYYPSKYWALAWPAWTVVLFLFGYAVFISLNLMRTPALDAYNTVTGKCAMTESLTAEAQAAIGAADDAVALHDLPIHLVNAC